MSTIRRPFRAPFEPIFLASNDGDTFIFKPKNAKRMVLPADYTENKLLCWNQRGYRWLAWWRYRGNQWASLEDHSGLVGWTLINSGESVKLIAGEEYSLSYTDLSGQWIRDYCNWQHDKTNHKFSFEFYLDNDLEETDPTVIYDDDETFWSAYQAGSGSYAITLAEETTEVQKGTSSLKMTVGAGSYADVGCEHEYTTLQDWSDKEFICLYLYGNNTGLTINIDIIDGTADADWGSWQITDNFTGWKRFVLPLRSPDVTGGASGTLDLSQVKTLRIWFTPTSEFTMYLDRTVVDVGQWVKVEVFVPDNIAYTELGSLKVYIYSWDGNEWRHFYQPHPFTQNIMDAANIRLFFLNGTTQNEILGGDERGLAFYSIGERAESKTPMPQSDGLAGSITFSSYYGCKKRIGFAIKMPPDDGQDSSTYGISQCKLKLEVYYDKVDVDYYPYELWGVATYEFENSSNQYYGLQNMNDSWIAFFDPDGNEVEFLILSQRPLGLKVRADENEEIDRVELTLKKGTVVYAGQLYHSNLSADLDGDGVPDVFEEGLG